MNVCYRTAANIERKCDRSVKSNCARGSYRKSANFLDSQVGLMTAKSDCMPAGYIPEMSNVKLENGLVKLRGELSRRPRQVFAADSSGLSSEKKYSFLSINAGGDQGGGL